MKEVQRFLRIKSSSRTGPESEASHRPRWPLPPKGNISHEAPEWNCINDLESWRVSPLRVRRGTARGRLIAEQPARGETNGSERINRLNFIFQIGWHGLRYWLECGFICGSRGNYLQDFPISNLAYLMQRKEQADL